MRKTAKQVIAEKPISKYAYQAAIEIAHKTLTKQK